MYPVLKRHTSATWQYASYPLTQVGLANSKMDPKILTPDTIHPLHSPYVLTVIPFNTSLAAALRGFPEVIKVPNQLTLRDSQWVLPNHMT